MSDTPERRTCAPGTPSATTAEKVTGEPPPAEAPQAGGPPASLWSDAWYDLRRRPMFIVSAGPHRLLVVMSFWPSLFTSINPFDARPASCDARQGPIPGHLFGHDSQGCDVYAAPSTAPATRSSSASPPRSSPRSSAGCSASRRLPRRPRRHDPSRVTESSSRIPLDPRRAAHHADVPGRR